MEPNDEQGCANDIAEEETCCVLTAVSPGPLAVQEPYEEDQYPAAAPTTTVDLYLLPGRSIRRKQYPLGITFWEIKQDIERELRFPALVVAVAPPPAASTNSPPSHLPWSTTLQDVGFLAGAVGTLRVYLLRRAEDNEGRDLPSLEDLGAQECLTDATAGRPKLNPSGYVCNANKLKVYHVIYRLFKSTGSSW